MAEIGKVRIRVPSTIRAGDVVRARVMVMHPMERIERDAQGGIVERRYNYVHTVTAEYQGKTVATFDTTQSVSENPLLSFAFKATGPGTLKVTFVDTTGGRYEGTLDIKPS